MRQELKWFIDEHNSHRIRKQKDRKTPQGIPEDLYNFPNHFGTVYSLKTLLIKCIKCIHTFNMLYCFFQVSAMQ